MEGNYWILGILTFLFVLSIKKYKCLDTLRESIEEYLSDISPQETVEGDDIIVLEELRDVIEDFVVRNPEIFSGLNHNKDE
jgi:DNA recombination-dependent growth factor C